MHKNQSGGSAAAYLRPEQSGCPDLEDLGFSEGLYQTSECELLNILLNILQSRTWKKEVTNGWV